MPATSLGFGSRWQDRGTIGYPVPELIHITIVGTKNVKAFTWLVGGPQFKFVTELSPEEFALRFADSIDKPHYFPIGGPTGATRILGKLLSHGRFSLQERCLYRNSGLPYFNGHVQPCGGGSEIVGSFSVHPIALSIMVLFLGWASIFAVIGCFIAVSSLIEGHQHALWGLLAAVAALAGLVAAVVFTTVISEKKQKMYIEFFAETFEAKLIERRNRISGFIRPVSSIPREQVDKEGSRRRLNLLPPPGIPFHCPCHPPVRLTDDIQHITPAVVEGNVIVLFVTRIIEHPKRGEGDTLSLDRGHEVLELGSFFRFAQFV